MESKNSSNDVAATEDEIETQGDPIHNSESIADTVTGEVTSERYPQPQVSDDAKSKETEEEEEATEQDASGEKVKAAMGSSVEPDFSAGVEGGKESKTATHGELEKSHDALESTSVNQDSDELESPVSSENKDQNAETEIDDTVPITESGMTQLDTTQFVHSAADTEGSTKEAEEIAEPSSSENVITSEEPTQEQSNDIQEPLDTENEEERSVSKEVDGSDPVPTEIVEDDPPQEDAKSTEPGPSAELAPASDENSEAQDAEATESAVITDPDTITTGADNLGLTASTEEKSTESHVVSKLEASDLASTDQDPNDTEGEVQSTDIGTGDNSKLEGEMEPEQQTPDTANDVESISKTEEPPVLAEEENIQPTSSAAEIEPAENTEEAKQPEKDIEPTSEDIPSTDPPSTDVVKEEESETAHTPDQVEQESIVQPKSDVSEDTVSGLESKPEISNAVSTSEPPEPTHDAEKETAESPIITTSENDKSAEVDNVHVDSETTIKEEPSESLHVEETNNNLDTTASGSEVSTLPNQDAEDETELPSTKITEDDKDTETANEPVDSEKATKELSESSIDCEEKDDTTSTVPEVAGMPTQEPEEEQTEPSSNNISEDDKGTEANNKLDDSEKITKEESNAEEKNDLTTGEPESSTSASDTQPETSTSEASATQSSRGINSTTTTNNNTNKTASSDDTDDDTTTNSDSENDEESDSEEEKSKKAGSDSSSEGESSDENDSSSDSDDDTPNIYLYTSLASGDFHVTTDTHRLAHILKAHAIEFKMVDLGTNERAKKIWRWRGKGRRLPAVIREDEVVGNLAQIQEAVENNELREVVLEDEIMP